MNSILPSDPQFINFAAIFFQNPESGLLGWPDDFGERIGVPYPYSAWVTSAIHARKANQPLFKDWLGLLPHTSSYFLKQDDEM